MTDSLEPTLSTVRQFAARHPAFTEGALRWLVFQASNPDAARDPARVRAFRSVIVRLGRRVLIDERAFFAWLRAGRQP